MKKQENINCTQEKKNQSVETDSKMPQILELGKNFKAAIIPMLNK